ncbi:putative toxin-antitoxin system toxin component, PIN family [Leptospira kirschneri str. 200801925]|nr:putative toxin-antitoxin system toxin component, PIN family [Leptospira kirschneri str. 200801925]
MRKISLSDPYCTFSCRKFGSICDLTLFSTRFLLFFPSYAELTLNTNIYISAILFKGKPRFVFQDLIDEFFTGYISREILDEIESTLSKTKFKLDDNVLSEIRNIITLIKNKPIQDYLELRDRDLPYFRICLCGKSRLLETKIY